MYESLQPAFGSIEDALRNIGQINAEPTGLLRINTSRVVAKYIIEPHLSEFLTRYPKLKIELIMDDGLANIIADGCDAGIRLGSL